MRFHRPGCTHRRERCYILMLHGLARITPSLLYIRMLGCRSLGSICVEYGYRKKCLSSPLSRDQYLSGLCLYLSALGSPSVGSRWPVSLKISLSVVQTRLQQNPHIHSARSSICVSARCVVCNALAGPPSSDVIISPKRFWANDQMCLRLWAEVDAEH